MAHTEKTVFISYRRTNLPWALAIYKHLTNQGFDVFFDYNSIKSGDFEQIVTQNINARTHFLVLLTPSALEFCNQPGDVLRREIELALDEKRNIVPLFFNGFNFSSPSISRCLTGKLDLLKTYKDITVTAESFDESMSRLCDQLLSGPFPVSLHPISDTTENAVKIQQAAARKAKKIQQKELLAQEWFEKAKEFDDTNKPDEAIHSYTKAIELKSDYVEAYTNRGLLRHDTNDMDGAFEDSSKAIRLNPNSALAYYNRGRTLHHKSDLEGAIKDYNKAIQLNPDAADAYYNRGIARSDKGDLDGAIKDYNEAIRLNPNYADAYNNRGIIRSDKGDLDGAIQDYNEAIRLNPEDADAYLNRGILWEENKQHYHSALADYQKYLDLGGERKEVAEWVIDLNKKIEEPE